MYILLKLLLLINNMEAIYNLSPLELYEKAQIFKNMNDYDNFAIYITMAANYNYEPAIKCFTYDNIIGNTKENYNITFNFYSESSIDENLQENTYSLYMLARIYNYGLIGDINLDLAIELYKRSISKGCVMAIYNLAKIYCDRGDYKQGIELYKIGIIKGNIECCNGLAYMYYYELGIEQNYEKAEELYQQAALGGSDLAINNLCIIYAKSYFKNKRNEIIQFFSKINQIEKIADIYGFDETICTIIRDNYKYQKTITDYELEISDLKKEVANLKAHIAASPDGELYFQAKSEWDNINANKKS